MKKILLFVAVFYSIIGQAQTTAGFEDFNLAPESFLNGEDGSGGFTDGNIFLPNAYNDAYGSWSGWSISNTTDVTTPGYTNQYSAITAGGHDGSATFATAFVFGTNYIGMENEAADEPVAGMYVTNSTYAYLSMLEGDAFAKKFGGLTGNDPDYFLLTIKKIQNGTLYADSVNFYLADFRFDNNSEDYIIDEWTYVDLSSLGPVDSLVLTLSSTDVGAYGMNTPASFCIDNATTSDGIVNTNSPFANNNLAVFPNPTSQLLNVENIALNSVCKIYNMQGMLLLSQKADSDLLSLDVSQLAAGSYFLSVNEDGLIRSGTFVKQ